MPQFYFEELILNYYITENLFVENKFKSKIQKQKFLYSREMLYDKIFLILRDTLYQMVLGELRHCKDKTYNHDFEVKNFESYLGISRSSVYKDAFKFSPESLKTIEKIFSEMSWKEGYGGESWAKITRVLRESFLEKVNKQVWIEKVLYLQHNGGIAFNKGDAITCYYSKKLTISLLDLGRNGNFLKDFKEKVLIVKKEYEEVYGKFLKIRLCKFLKGLIEKLPRECFAYNDAIMLYVPHKYGDKKIELVITELEEEFDKDDKSEKTIEIEVKKVEILGG